MRLIVLLITTIGLLAGACASPEAPRTERSATVQLKQPKFLASASACERRGGSASDLRRPPFALPPSSEPVAPTDVVAVHRIVEPVGYRWVRESNVTARGPPRG